MSGEFHLDPSTENKTPMLKICLRCNFHLFSVFVFFLLLFLFCFCFVLTKDVWRFHLDPSTKNKIPMLKIILACPIKKPTNKEAYKQRVRQLNKHKPTNQIRNTLTKKQRATSKKRNYLPQSGLDSTCWERWVRRQATPSWARPSSWSTSSARWRSLSPTSRTWPPRCTRLSASASTTSPLISRTSWTISATSWIQVLTDIITRCV